MKKTVVVWLAICLLCCSPVLANYDLVISNSNDWVDVYNSLLYGSLSSTPVLFLSDQSQANSFLATIPPDIESVLVVESDERISPTVSRVLESLGYEVEVLLDEDTSFFFADLADVDSYVLVDKDFPSNGISVAPYAANTESWVFFIDGTQDTRVIEYVDGASVITYGRVSQGILQATTPDIVIDKGNRYMNSVELAKEFLELTPARQYVLAQGSFIESEFFIPDFPVLVVGISTTPDPIRDFFIDSPVESAVVVGQLSVPPSVNLKRFIEENYDREIKLVAKLGQTSPEFGNNDILPLNIFPIPSPTIEIDIESAFFNQITGQLEVRFTNIGDVFTTFVPSIDVEVNGQSILLEGDEEEYYLEKSESRTIQFPLDLESSDEALAQITIVYGESKDAFDLSKTEEFDPLEQVSIVDDSDIAVQSISYDGKNKVFLIEILNNGTVPTYVDASLLDIIVAGDTQTVSSPRAVLIQPGQTGVLVIYTSLTGADVLANAQVTFIAEYGQRDFALIKSQSGTVTLETSSNLFSTLSNNSGILLAGVVVLVVLILLFFILRKSSYACKHCGKEYKKKPRSCQSCGSRFFKRK